MEVGAAEAVSVEALHANSYVTRVEITDDSPQIDRSYQRDVSQAMVDGIAENWDVVASELLLVSDRGYRDPDGPIQGGLFIVNGQHRSWAAKKLGITHMDARIIDLSDSPDPAAIEAVFRLKTNVRLGDRPLERFKAQLRAGDPDSIALENLFALFDTEVNKAPTMEGGINSISTFEKLYKLDQGQLLTEAMKIIKEAFNVVGGRTATASMINSVCWFVEKHASESDRSRFVEKLGALGTQALDRKARAMQSTMGGTLWQNYYRALVEMYNERLQDSNRLEWRLRGSTRLQGRGGAWGKSSN